MFKLNFPSDISESFWKLLLSRGPEEAPDYNPDIDSRNSSHSNCIVFNIFREDIDHNKYIQIYLPAKWYCNQMAPSNAIFFAVLLFAGLLSSQAYLENLFKALASNPLFLRNKEKVTRNRGALLRRPAIPPCMHQISFIDLCIHDLLWNLSRHNVVF